MVIVPIYGHNGWGKPMTPSARPTAIVQFINKSNGRITEYDIEKIKSMQHLLGRSIDNISEHHSVINSGLSVMASIEQVQSLV
jgi:hypothetical protein